MICNAGHDIGPMCEGCESQIDTTIDTANEVGTLEECLHSTLMRTQVALMLIKQGRTDCLATILEDIAVGVQYMTDKYMVENVGNTGRTRNFTA